MLESKGKVDTVDGDLEIEVVEGEKLRATRTTYRGAELHINGF
jgi:hypothetical protein